jgi:hypothetical protein
MTEVATGPGPQRLDTLPDGVAGLEQMTAAQNGGNASGNSLPAVIPEFIPSQGGPVIERAPSGAFVAGAEAGVDTTIAQQTQGKELVHVPGHRTEVLHDDPSRIGRLGRWATALEARATGETGGRWLERGRARLQRARNNFVEQFAPAGRTALEAVRVGRLAVRVAVPAVVGATGAAIEGTANFARATRREAVRTPDRVTSRVHETRAEGRRAAAAVADARENVADYMRERAENTAGKADRLRVRSEQRFAAASAALKGEGTERSLKTAAKEAAMGVVLSVRAGNAEGKAPKHAERLERRTAKHARRVANTDRHAVMMRQHLGSADATRRFAGLKETPHYRKRSNSPHVDRAQMVDPRAFPKK